MSAEITTIIPTYRRPRLLQRALRSVLDQTFRDFHVCVYDNASEDDTEALVRATAAGDTRVEYFRHPENIGGARNFLFGMQRVTTPYFSFLSDDDVLLSHFFETALAGFEQCPQALMVAASTVEVTSEGDVRYVPLARWSREGVFYPPAGAFAMLDNKHPTWTTVLFRRESIEKVGLLDLSVGATSDLDFELRIAARFPIVVSFRPCGAYVSHPQAGSSGETGAVVPGFERLRANIASDERIPGPARRRLNALLARQVQRKLLEIWVKGLVRGDDWAALEAAQMMRDRYGPRAGGAMLALAWSACTRLPCARAIALG